MSDEEPILIIDDNPLNLELVTYLLKSKGYKIQTATTAKDALQLLTAFKPRLILMDLKLPDMNGLDLTLKLKKDAKFQNIPIIAITACAMEGDKEKAVAAGCDAYITKPIDIKTLPDIIVKFLRTK